LGRVIARLAPTPNTMGKKTNAGRLARRFEVVPTALLESG
jgi:hypothetical protein